MDYQPKRGLDQNSSIRSRGGRPLAAPRGLTSNLNNPKDPNSAEIASDSKTPNSPRVLDIAESPTLPKLPDDLRITPLETDPTISAQEFENSPSPESASSEFSPNTSPLTPTTLRGSQTIEDQNPENAKDGEKLEKEWESRVGQVISKNKGDPWNKFKGLKQLIKDYLEKRFNRHLGDRNE